MPKVGSKSFPYTPAGKKEAASYASKTGQKMVEKKGGKKGKGD